MNRLGPFTRSAVGRGLALAAGVSFTALCRAGEQDAAGTRPGTSAPPSGQPAGASGAPAAGLGAAEVDAWRVEVAVFAWLTAMSGTAGARGLTADVDLSFGDILDDSDSLMAFSGRLEVGYGRFGAYVDGLYAELGGSGLSGPAGLGDIDLTVQQAILDFGVMYRIGEWPATGSAAEHPAHGVTLDVYGGGRYAGLDVTLEPAILASRSQSESWVDPIIGAKVVVPLSEHWVTYASGDIGGFGVASELTWGATVAVGYTFTIGGVPSTVFVGYRAIGWDYTNGSGTDEFRWDIVEHGPLIGFAMRF